MDPEPEDVDSGARAAGIDDDGEFGRSAKGEDRMMRTTIAKDVEERIRVLLGDLGLGKEHAIPSSLTISAYYAAEITPSQSPTKFVAPLMGFTLLGDDCELNSC